MNPLCRHTIILIKFENISAGTRERSHVCAAPKHIRVLLNIILPCGFMIRSKFPT